MGMILKRAVLIITRVRTVVGQKENIFELQQIAHQNLSLPCPALLAAPWFQSWSALKKLDWTRSGFDCTKQQWLKHKRTYSFPEKKSREDNLGMEWWFQKVTGHWAPSIFSFHYPVLVVSILKVTSWVQVSFSALAIPSSPQAAGRWKEEATKGPTFHLNLFSLSSLPVSSGKKCVLIPHSTEFRQVTILGRGGWRGWFLCGFIATLMNGEEWILVVTYYFCLEKKFLPGETGNCRLEKANHSTLGRATQWVAASWRTEGRCQAVWGSFLEDLFGWEGFCRHQGLRRAAQQEAPTWAGA